MCTVHYDDCDVRIGSWEKLLSGLRYSYTMCKCTITVLVCTVHVHRMPYAVSVCANTFTRSVGAIYWRKRRKNGKYKYANTRVVFELMHTTKVSWNVVLIGNTNMLISIPLHCAARWKLSPLKCAQPLSRIEPKAQ